jgi:hypothetical protein
MVRGRLFLGSSMDRRWGLVALLVYAATLAQCVAPWGGLQPRGIDLDGRG